MKNRYKIGTLVNDRGNLGIISEFLPRGCETVEGLHKINWRDNYKILFASDSSYVIGVDAFHRLVLQGQIKIIDSKRENQRR